MNTKRKKILLAAIILLLTLIPCQHIKFDYKVGTYKISSSFWSLGPKYFIEINSSSGAKVSFLGGYLKLIAQASNTPYIDDIILSKFESDTVFIFRPNAVIRNDGFFVETVIPPHWVQDNTDSKLYRIDLGTHYGRLFHRKDHDYEVLDSAFYRITTSGDAIYVHMGNSKVEAISPYRVEIKYLGIIPIPSFITRLLLD